MPPGDHVLNLVFPEPQPDGETDFAGDLTLIRPLTVPEMPGGRSDDSLDLGELRLRSPNAHSK